jgi:hypothetical protein
MQWVANVSKTLAFVSLKAFRNLVLGTQLLTMRNFAYPLGIEALWHRAVRSCSTTSMKPATEEEANAWLMNFLVRYNGMEHRSEPHSRLDDWLGNLHF